MLLPGTHELSYVFKKFMKDHSQPRSAGGCDTTLLLRTPSFLGSDAEHFIMSTPQRHKREDGCLRSPPGLGTHEYPTLVSIVPTNHEEAAIAKAHMMALIGQEVVVVPDKNRVVRGARSVYDDIELDTNMKQGDELRPGRTFRGLAAPRKPMASQDKGQWQTLAWKEGLCRRYFDPWSSVVGRSAGDEARGQGS